MGVRYQAGGSQCVPAWIGGSSVLRAIPENSCEVEGSALCSSAQSEQWGSGLGRTQDLGRSGSSRLGWGGSRLFTRAPGVLLLGAEHRGEQDSYPFPGVPREVCVCVCVCVCVFTLN